MELEPAFVTHNLTSDFICQKKRRLLTNRKIKNYLRRSGRILALERAIQQ